MSVRLPTWPGAWYAHTWGGQFTALAWLSVFLAVAWLGGAYAALVQVGELQDAITRVAAPGADAATRLAVGVQQMGTDAADFLVTATPVEDAALHQALTAAHQRDVQALQTLGNTMRDSLFTARTNAAGAVERQRVTDIESAWSDLLVQTALEQYALARGRRQEAHAAWNTADAVIVTRLEPAVADLGRMKSGQLATLFELAGTRLPLLEALFAAVGGATAACMALACLLMTVRTHRLLNAGMLAGLAVVGLWSAFVLQSLQAARQDLVSAELAWQTVMTVDQVVLQGSRACAAQTRWLMDGGAAGPWDDTWRDATQSVQERLAHVAVPGSEGRQALSAAVARWEDFRNADARMRDLYRSGRRQAAVGASLGPGDDAFIAFSGDLERLEASARTQFETTTGETARASSMLKRWAWSPLLAGLLLFLLGIRSRLAEF